MIGCCVEWKCFVACLFCESSQQPTWPHVRHRRRCTHVSPDARHSSQPAVFGLAVTTKFRWPQCADMTGKRRSAASRLAATARRVQHPDASLSLVDPDLEKAGGRHIAMLIADIV